MDARSTGHAYVTETAAFLPGPPIANLEMEGVLGMVGGKTALPEGGPA